MGDLSLNYFYKSVMTNLPWKGSPKVEQKIFTLVYLKSSSKLPSNHKDEELTRDTWIVKAYLDK
jgi:hypothetical protein